MASLVIEDAPAEVVERLQRRAARRAHSVEAEMLEIIADAVIDEDEPYMTPSEILAELRALGHSSPDEATAMIRADRDRADGRH